MNKLSSYLYIVRLFVILHFTAMLKSQTLKQTKKPVIHNKPFIFVWNAPTEQCRLRYQVDLDLSVFDIFANTNETLSGSNITIFYHTHLGHYPYFTDDGQPVNGGVPQSENLKNHLQKAKLDINKLVPNMNFQGLGVIDWENWRPQWDRNWGNKTIYRNASIKLVKNHHPDWTSDMIMKQAKAEFEEAGKGFMSETVQLAQDMRPSGLWGYYLFPDCYNYDYKIQPHSYTGRCPVIELMRNDFLVWLWKSSNALYPSIYLDYILKSSPNALKFVHHRVKEAMRVASMARKDYSLPVFVYARPFYAYTFNCLTEIDLVHTIGETAALGAAGIVLWGGMQYASTKESCTVVKKYIDGPLGHYIVNVTSAAKLCSKVLCKKNGRCVRKNADSSAYLHLNPNSYKIRKHSSGRGHYVSGKPLRKDKEHMKHYFVCQCYEGWTGMSCELPEPEEGKQKEINLNNGTRNSLFMYTVFYVIFQFCILVI